MSRTGRSENEPFSAQQCRTERAGRSTVIGFAPIGFALLSREYSIRAHSCRRLTKPFPSSVQRRIGSCR